MPCPEKRDVLFQSQREIEEGVDGGTRLTLLPDVYKTGAYPVHRTMDAPLLTVYISGQNIKETGVSEGFIESDRAVAAM